MVLGRLLVILIMHLTTRSYLQNTETNKSVHEMMVSQVASIKAHQVH